MGSGRKTGLVIALSVAGGVAAAQPAQKVTGPVAVYWMSAQTQSGFGMPTAGGRQPSGQDMMRMMMGGGSGAQHLLTLQLGSSTKPAGAPEAEHLPPTALGAGTSLPLVTPRQAPPETDGPTIPQQPRGRMLIFWGCGEHAKAGQPVIVDFAQMAAGKVPPGLAASQTYTPMRGPSPSRNATYGDWPNERGRTTVPPGGSLVGQHIVQGNYTPEILFSLNEQQDFMAPLTLTANAVNPSGSGQLGWQSVPGALAYQALAIGGGQNETVVFWSSSAIQGFMSLPDYLSPGDITRLTQSGALTGAQATSCVIPKEVVDAAPQAMVQLAAYGQEANFVHPARPADPKVAWNQEWQVKVRYRSSTGGILGMEMPNMGADDSGDEHAHQPGRRPTPQDGAQTPPRTTPGQILRGLGRIPGF
jgi:hypothetical protein